MKKHSVNKEFKVLFVIWIVSGLFSAPGVFAEQNQTSVRMAVDAAAMLPETLSSLVSRFWPDIIAAMQDQERIRKQHPEYFYYYPQTDKGKAPQLIAREAKQAVSMIRKRKPMQAVFRMFGRIAYTISVSFNPLNTADDDPGEIYYYSSFEAYLLRNYPKFRILFDGYQIVPCEVESMSKEISQRLARIGKFYSPLVQAYQKKINAGLPLTFDYQSVPFGIAMISYSGGVNTIVDIWCSIWKNGGGELNNPPLTLSD